MRAFIAVDIPSDVKDAIGKLQRKLMREVKSSVKWVEVANIHTTLRFLGEVPEEKIEQLSKVLPKGGRGIAPFKINIKGLGAFPNLSRPRVIWVGMQAQGNRMVQLYSQIETLVRDLGFTAERRAFSSHLTIGRIKQLRDQNEWVNAIGKRQELFFGEATVDCFYLFQSILKPQGPEYRKLKKFDLPGEG
ncbi:RNA 2',3'-cyclic phosphodiesterase [bacterium (candidate division B38) B3_B38]|nr:MAG: RNA 2',3'-cyclic phosphodiesterase [bacterium (candidate division B38) B3_B38]